MASNNMNTTTYTSDGGGVRKVETVEMVFNPTTRTWVPATSSVSVSSTSEETIPDNSTGNDTSSQVDSQTQSEKEFIEVEFYTLVGEVTVLPSKKTIRIKVGDTVCIEGLGSYLSGNYFVSAIKRTLSSDSGYSQTLTVIKNGFGDSLKKKSVSTDETSRNEEVAKVASAFKEGDSVTIVGDAIYSTGETVPAWVKEKTLTVSKVSVDGAKVLLMPINSWTFSKYVKKV